MAVMGAGACSRQLPLSGCGASVRAQVHMSRRSSGTAPSGGLRAFRGSRQLPLQLPVMGARRLQQAVLLLRACSASGRVQLCMSATSNTALSGRLEALAIAAGCHCSWYLQGRAWQPRCGHCLLHRSLGIVTSSSCSRWVRLHQVRAPIGSGPLEPGGLAWGPVQAAHLQSWQAPMVLPGGQVKHVGMAGTRRSCPSAVWGHGEQPRGWLELLRCKPDLL